MVSIIDQSAIEQQSFNEDINMKDDTLINSIRQLSYSSSNIDNIYNTVISKIKDAATLGHMDTFIPIKELFDDIDSDDNQSLLNTVISKLTDQYFYVKRCLHDETREKIIYIDWLVPPSKG